MKNLVFLFILLSSIIFITSCKKKEKTDTPIPDISSMVLSDFSNSVAVENYKNISAKADLLNISVNNLAANTTEANITIAQADWRNLRNEWEQSESFLFGPVATDGLDPAIDTWPVNKNDMDSLLASSTTFTDSYMISTQESLKGFHPLEYILFGATGNKTYTEFTQREKEYMVSLAKDLKRVCNLMHSSWDKSQGNFVTEFSTAGIGSTTYKTKKDAMLEVVNAMAGICDEVANGKIEEPFIAQNPSLEESPFSKNSFNDFKNNLKGVQNVYTCSYSVSGKSFSTWTSQYNKSLDAKIKLEISTALSSLDAFTKPFGQAIIDEPVQIQNAQKNINALKNTLENELIPLINANIKN